MKDEIFSFGLKEKNYFCQTSTDNARHKNVPPPLDDRRIFPKKIGAANYTMWDKSCNLIGQKQ